MKKAFISIAIVFAAAFATAGTMRYADGDAQHRKPNEPATTQQPARPRQPPQATPRDGQKPPSSDSPSNQAVPPPPDARRDPDGLRRGPARGPVVVQYLSLIHI